MGPPYTLLLLGPLHLVGSSLHAFRASANLRQLAQLVVSPSVHWVPISHADRIVPVGGINDAWFLENVRSLLLCTRVRFGEAAALRWEDIQLDIGRPFVSIKRGVSDDVVQATKTKASQRTIALIPEIAIALRAHRYRRPNSEWVFTSPTDKFYGPSETVYVLKRACEAACVPIVGWHKLRHSCATQLLTNGVPLTVVKEVLGHTSIEVTSIYTLVTPQLMWDYMEKLSPTNANASRVPGETRTPINAIAA